MAVREALPPPGARRTSWCGILSCERKKKKKNRAARRWIYSAESSSLSYISAPPAKEAIAWWKGIMVKVNKQWLGYCVADWKGNYFVVEAERCVCVCVCMYCFHRCVCVRVRVEPQPRVLFFPLRVSLGSESSSWPVSVSQPTGLWNDPPQGSPGALQPRSAVPFTLLLPSYVLFLSPSPLFSLPALHSLTTAHSLTLSLSLSLTSAEALTFSIFFRVLSFLFARLQ